METRSNIRLVLAVVAILLLGLVWFALHISGASRPLDARYQIRFSKNVAGLEAGSGVTLSGVSVGRIETISIDPVDPGTVLITLALEEDVPIRRGVRADISRSLLNGDATLVLLPSSEGPLINPVGNDEVAVIQAVGGGGSSDPAQDALSVARQLDGVVASLDAEGQRNIAKRLDGIVDQTANWETTASRLTNSIKPGNVRSVSNGLAKARETAQHATNSIDSADGDIARVRESIRSFGEGADRFSTSLEKARSSVRQTARRSREAEQTVRSLRADVEKGKETVEKVLPDEQ